jgi:hypothetical protein
MEDIMRSTSKTRILGLVLLLTMLLVASTTTWAAPPSSRHRQSGFDCGDVTEIPQTECEALVVLYESTDGDNWDNNTDWLTTNTPCTWHGVTCNAGHVGALRLAGGWGGGNNLTGSLPPEIGNLIHLEDIYLAGNELSGAIPSEIGNLSKLKEIRMYNNQLTGTLPSEIGQLTSLTMLALDNNQITGAIPPEIGNLAMLQTLSISGNQLDFGHLGRITSRF